MSQGVLRVSRAAAEAPERTAVVSDGREISYAELASDVRQAVSRLVDRGLDPETPRVAMVGENRYAHVVTFYALAELGVPVLLLHPRSTRAERERDLMATSSVLVDPIAVVPGLSSGPPRGYSPPPPIAPEKGLAIVRTSGSSGRPKWVVLSRRAFAAAARASAYNLGWQEGDRWLLGLPIAHVGGLSILTRCLAGRRTVVLERMPRFDPQDIARTVDGRRITLLSVVPTMLGRLLELRAWRPPAFLRAILVGGAAAPRSLLDEAHARDWPVLTTYGLTEACSQVATQTYATRYETVAGCGPPLDSVEVRIREQAIEVRGEPLLSAYLDDGEAPAASPSPFTADGWLRTGDFGRLDDEGHLHVLGRRDAVIVSGGENVHPAEVEEALEAYPGVTASCVFGVEDAEWGERVAAAVVSEGLLDVADLAVFLADRLAPFKRPRCLATLPSLPRGTLGKIDRKATRRLAEPRLRVFRYPDPRGA